MTLPCRIQIRELLSKSLSMNNYDDFAINLVDNFVTYQFNDCYDSLCQFFKDLLSHSQNAANSQEQNDQNDQLLRKEAIQELVNQMFVQQNTKKQLILLRLITKLVKNRIVDVRIVGEFLFAGLVYSIADRTQQATSPFIWCKVLECIIRFIPSLDYKACRDIFKMLLETIKKIPHAGSSLPTHSESDSPPRKRKLDQLTTTTTMEEKSDMDQMTDDIKLETLFKAVSFIIDSDNYFMPRYLAINEIKLVLSFGKEPYHQRFHKIITDFVDSFIPTANLISISGRERMLPIVGFSNLCSLYSFWRFTPGTCKYNTSGPLPYNKHSFKPNKEVFFYLFRQNSPQYLLITLMSLNRNSLTSRQRYVAFEEEFASTIIETMKQTEETADKVYENLRIWNNLIIQLTNLNMVLNLNFIISHVTQRLKKMNVEFKHSRDWLMWLLLSSVIINAQNKNTMVEQQNKSCFPEFSDLFDILYKESEPLPAPDCTQFVAVIKMAALSFWFYTNKVCSTTNGDQQSQIPLNSRQIYVPHVLKNHFAMLQDIIQSQNFADSYTLSVCLNAYSTDTITFSPLLTCVMEKIGKSAINSQLQNQNQPLQPNLFNNFQPLSNDMISSLSYHVKIHLCNYLSYIISPKASRNLNIVIPPSIIETFVKLILADPENFIKYFITHFWANILQSSQAIQSIAPQQTIYLHQQMNLAVELVAFRFKRIGCTQRCQLLICLNSLYAPTKPEQINFIKHPLIYTNSQCAIIKLLSVFNGSDYFELLNSIYSNSKHGPKAYINPESEEINKAIVYLIARAIQATSSDLLPNFDNKDKEEAIRNILKQIFETTPIYFHDYALESFPTVVEQFIRSEQAKRVTEKFIDSSNIQYKMTLKRLVESDYKKFSECRHETQVQSIFLQNQNQSLHTILCVFFHLLQDETVQDLNTFLQFVLSNLQSMENRRISLAIRTLCDYLIIEANGKPLEVLHSYMDKIVLMINNYNLFTYDRFLFVMTFRSFDLSDYQLSLRLLNILLCQKADFKTKMDDYCAESGEWDTRLFSGYLMKYPEKFHYEGIREILNVPVQNELALTSTYGNMLLRCLPSLDYLNGRYIEVKKRFQEADELIDNLNRLYKFHLNPITFTFNTLYFYHSKFESTILNDYDQEVYDRSKKNRLLRIVSLNNQRYLSSFTRLFQSYAANENGSVDIQLNGDYYFDILRRLANVNTIDASFDLHESEFSNPACQLIYVTLCELIFLDLFTREPSKVSGQIAAQLLHVLSARLGEIDQAKSLVYWINGAGLILSNLPESYWQSVYGSLKDLIKNNALLNQRHFNDPKQSMEELLDRFDLTLACEKSSVDEITMAVTIYHSIWTHSNANHFQYFVKYLKENIINEIDTESKFLFVCKLIGPYLSKIHIENTNLLLELVNNLYDAILVVSKSNEKLYYMDTICNFFYHLKYRHIGESIKEKIVKIIPDLRPELQKLFKYITSDLNQQQTQQIK